MTKAAKCVDEVPGCCSLTAPTSRSSMRSSALPASPRSALFLNAKTGSLQANAFASTGLGQYIQHPAPSNNFSEALAFLRQVPLGTERSLRSLAKAEVQSWTKVGSGGLRRSSNHLQNYSQAVPRRSMTPHLIRQHALMASSFFPGSFGLIDQSWNICAMARENA